MINNTDQQMIEIKKASASDPLFQKLYPFIEEILKSSRPTDKIFFSALQTFRKEVLFSGIDEKVKSFLQLPAHKRSNNFTCSVIDTILLNTLENLINLSNSCFSFFIKEELLINKGFDLTRDDGEPSQELIESLGLLIRSNISRLNINYQGNPKRDGEIWFSAWYNYNYKP